VLPAPEGDAPARANDVLKLLDNGYAVLLYRNALGSYTAAASREPEKLAGLLEARDSDDDCSFEAEFPERQITDDFTPEKALYRLAEKATTGRVVQEEGKVSIYPDALPPEFGPRVQAADSCSDADEYLSRLETDRMALLGACRSALAFLEDLRVPQTIPDAVLQVACGARVMDALRAAIARATRP
jgi:hypothetical protein